LGLRNIFPIRSTPQLKKYLNKEVFQISNFIELFFQSTSPKLATSEFLDEFANSSAYCGYDPTNSSLHLGT
jgi:tyrosyl-tRNA synthetase